MINDVSKTEGHGELIDGFRNLWNDSQIVRPTDRQADMASLILSMKPF